MLHVPRETENEPEQYQMRFREHAAVQSRVDFFFVDPRKLKVTADFNVRVMDSKETREHIASLKASIIANGVKVPLEVRLDDDEKIYIVAGHCRHAAVMEAIADGHEIKAVPCIPEPSRTSEEDRAVNLIVSNSGKPLAPLEVAAVVKRLVNFGWAEKVIAERLGWKSTNTVKQHLDLLALPESVKKHVRDGNVSATLARNISKGADPVAAAAQIAANLEENKRIKGKRSTKVTAKTIKRDRAKLKSPAATPEQIAEVLGDPVPQHIGAIGLAVSTPETPVVVSDPVAHVPMRFATAPDDQVSPHQRPGIKALIGALKPFADLCNDFDANAKSDDDLVEVFVRDVKRAWEVYTAAVGGSTEEAA